MRFGAILLCLFCAILSAGERVIIENGKSDYQIVIPDTTDDMQRVEKAADCLKKYLQEVSGVALPIVREAEHKEGPAFYLGATNKAKESGIDVAGLTGWMYCKKVIGPDIFLLGLDKSAGIKGNLEFHDREYLGQLVGTCMDVKDRTYKGWYGTYKAVLSFLDDEIGVRFLMPGENGQYVPRLDKVAVDDSLNFYGKSLFEYSNGRNYGDKETSIALDHVDIPNFKSYGGHSTPVAIPQHIFAESHPEYFILKDGKRQPYYGPAGGGHICPTNPDVKELMLKEIKRQHDAGYTWVQIGPTDGQVPCECESCRQVANGDPRERQWLLYRSLAEESLKRWPDLKLVLLAYGLTYLPPKTFDEFPPNVILEHCVGGDYAEYFKKWERFRNVPKTSYVYFFGCYGSAVLTPQRSPKYVARELRVLADSNVMSIWKCGWCESLGLEAPVSYVFSKLLEDPCQAPEALADEFYRGAYGNSYAPMKRFFDAMHNALDMTNGHAAVNDVERFPRNTEQTMMYIYRPSLIELMERELQLAEKIANPDPKVRARLALVREEFDFLASRSRIYSYVESFNISKSPALLPLIEEELKKRDALFDRWYDADGKMKPIPGFTWPRFENFPRSYLIIGGNMVNTGYPREVFGGIDGLWSLVKSPVSPAESVLVAKRLDGTAEEFFKKDFTEAELEFGQKMAPVRLRLAYDDKNLYVAAECKFLYLAWGTEEVEEWERLADCRTNELMEYFFSIPGSKADYYGVRYDTTDADGQAFCKTPFTEVEKAFEKQAKTWSHSTAVNAAEHRYVSTMTIPFAMLNADAPKAGDAWKMNAVRHHIPYPPEFNDRRAIIVPWCRLPEYRDASEVGNYGTLRFE